MTTHRSTKPKYYTSSLDNHLLEHVKDNPYLVLLISDNWKWSSHISKITNRTTPTLGSLRRNLKYRSKILKETAYTSIVRSVLNYSSSVGSLHAKQHCPSRIKPTSSSPFRLQRLRKNNKFNGNYEKVRLEIIVRTQTRTAFFTYVHDCLITWQ